MQQTIMTPLQPQIHPIYDEATATITYVVFDAPNGHAAIIDPVLNFQANSATTDTKSADLALAFIAQQGLTVDWILETHAHADHLSAAHYLQSKAGGKIAIGEHICQVQKVFKDLFNLEPEFAVDGSQFDHLFTENEIFKIGDLSAKALFVPGHTPADMAYQIGDVIFVGDTLFMPDVGTARCDFPGGDAHMLYQSIQKLLAFPENTRLFMCHDYPTADRSAQWESSVAQQRQYNIHVNETIDEATFVARRKARDATLSMPQLILTAIQINIRAGQLPTPENNGVSYLKIPLNAVR
ncbi:MBL fold metallo-hydrolase [Solimicrobium silvestre]|uniref:Zn-dependent hydrolase including glyoxylase n=1 Tax=Solimicrobium silvestre TaxID=2099400 RepID=A0A2S9GXH5_9BURK|nr:MBL fold metallo-hydrolase [Solimicrobium silvestre]PRC92427.1 Zn-dependent hydrolase including glyoxylase [Solimicrobium silvestre]